MEEVVLPWDRFRDWIHCIAVVTFDLELGQKVEVLCPRHVTLSDEEKSNICYLSLPDSNSGCMGDTKFYFRIRHKPSKCDKLSFQMISYYNARCSSPLKIDINFLYGFVFFRQIKDPLLKRGYFQKSVVILTKLPFMNLFYQILDVLAPDFFNHGATTLDAAVHDISQWGWPLPEKHLKLPFIGNIFNVIIPSTNTHHSSDNDVSINSVFPPHLLTSVNNYGSEIVYNASFKPGSSPPLNSLIFDNLKPVLTHIHLLWELVLTAEPIVVMSLLPANVSATVHTLIGMIQPLRYSADFRPYFTIHNTDFKEYTMKSSPPPSVILGVTNPFFAKTLDHWPHILRICDPNDMYGAKLKKAKDIKLLDLQSSFYTNYKPCIQKDKELLKKVMSGMSSQRSADIQSIILAKHLRKLTESFIIPLENYVESLSPEVDTLLPLKSAPLPRPFNQDEFIPTLETVGPQTSIGIKGDWEALYRRFFRSVNFSEWYDARYKEICSKIKQKHLEALSNFNIEDWMKGRDEVEIVDMVLKLRDQISQAEVSVTPLTKKKLESHISTIIRSVESDLRSVLNSCELSSDSYP